MSLTESTRISDLLLFEAHPEFNYVRENITVLSGTTAAAAIGQVLGRKVSGGTATETHAGNTGNGAMTLDVTTPVLTNARSGIYSVKCITAASNSGTFRVFDPMGQAIGDVAVAATFADQIKFVIADGATDFIVGDTFLVTVGALTYGYTTLTPGANDGTQQPVAVLLAAVDASGGDKTALAVVRGPVIYKDAGLVWTSGMTTAQKTLAKTQLGLINMPVRVALGS